MITKHLLKIINILLKKFYTFNLAKLGLMFNTDKAVGHFYLPHYQKHFRPYKFKKIKLLEIGVGGYEHPNYGGHSLRMWKSYFWYGKIFSLDIHDKSALEESRIKIFKGSQVDKMFLNMVLRQTGELDLIIDDGSHINEHVIETFKILFPKLKDGGIYVIEDTQASYWKDKGGDSENLNNPKTMMSFFKSLADGLNHKEFIIPDYTPSYFDQKIRSMHFYHNLIFIYKGDNDEPSNLVVNNIR
ncbi:class I SAM-dependent methyltransferase [Seonamhaeicola maritimus]|uniref:Class I SAM-dependent methyltransferase n=1 Tax=Seonamhaeicola maritimus TaxID=2591822 RepID=A0A5C7GK84_9FLAO|nr:class I SAM-dependent methyltransferase [Seonamhaeicola maritimus]TXG38859.1 class I SAM-dependent methyltransferase [Seonamhaeicola maritimus]